MMEWKCPVCGEWVSAEYQYHAHAEIRKTRPLISMSQSNIEVDKTYRTSDCETRIRETTGNDQQ